MRCPCCLAYIPIHTGKMFFVNEAIKGIDGEVLIFRGQHVMHKECGESLKLKTVGAMKAQKEYADKLKQWGYL